MQKTSRTLINDDYSRGWASGGGGLAVVGAVPESPRRGTEKGSKFYSIRSSLADEGREERR
jgi:hypothetical protein